MSEQAQTPLTELEFIVNRSPAVVFLWRAAENWPVEFVSDNVRQFGYTPEDFYTRRVLYAAIIHPDDLDRVAAEVTRYSSEQGRTEFVQEYRIITKTDEIRWTDDRTWIRRDASGAITHYQGIVLDITERKRAEEEARRRAAQAALVYEVGQRMSGKLELETLLPEIVTAVRDAFDYYSVLLMLVDKDAQRLTRHAFAGDDADLWSRDLSLAIGEGMMGQAVATGEIQLCGDVSTNSHYVQRAKETTKSELVVPIKCRQQVIGVLDLQCDELDAFDETDVMLMGTLADQVATAIENASLYEETRQRLQGEAMLFQASQRLASAPLRAEEVAEIAVYQLGRLLKTTECSFSLPHPTAEGVLQVLADFWVNEDGTEEWADGQESFNLSDYPATARVMETLKPLIVQINDPDADPAELAYMQENDTYTLVIIPLAVKGRAVGIMELETKEERFYSPEQLNMAMTLANQSAVALENARLYEAIHRELVERRQAEEALRESQDLFHSAFHKAEMGMAITRVQDLRYIEVNHALCSMLGYSREELLAKTALDITHPDDMDVGMPQTRQIEAGDYDTLQIEKRYMHKNGQVVWAILGAAAVRDAQGKPRYFVSQYQDITERKRAEEALRESEERYRHLVENAPIGIVSVNLEGQVIDANPGLLAILGSPSVEATREINFSSYPPLVEAGIAADFRRCLESGEPLIAERFYTSRWGKSVYMRFHLTPVRDPDGPIAGVQAVAEDITERKQAEEAIRRANADLKARVDELAMLNLVTQTVTTVRDLHAILEIVAEALTSLFGVLGTVISLFNAEKTELTVLAQQTRDEVKGKSLIGWTLSTASTPALQRVIEQPESTIIPQVQTNPLAEPIREIARTWGVCCLLNIPLQIRGEIIGIISMGTGQVGREFTPAEIRLAETVAGQIAGAIENARLFEEEQNAKQAAEKARLAAEEARLAAEAANVAKSEFLANMSHELRSPLNAILGFAQLMARDRQVTTEQREHLETIIQSGDHLLTLINDILEMSKIEAGRTTLYERSFDLHLLLNTLQDMFYLRAKDKGLQIVLDQADDVPRYVRADESKLRQVLINLLSNAVKFTQEGGITLRVRQVPNAEFATLDFEVEDTGIGIAPDDLERMFDPFVQTASGQEAEGGTGLGLSISQQYVHLMGGDITVTSTSGQGSIFRFSIPFKPAEETGTAATQAAEQPTGQVIGLAPDQPVYRLLVAEDRKANREVLVELLTGLGSPPAGFDVRAVVNGEEAVEVWESWAPHVIWMDMRMPVLDGHKATRRIKATDKGQDTIIIALTASAFEEDRVTALEQGCDDFVRKPFREAEIFGKLAEHLGVRFVCEGDDGQRQIMGRDQFQMALTRLELAEVLATLPAGWVRELEQAVILGNLRSIYSLIDRIQEFESSAPGAAAALTGPLANLARNFEHDEMLRSIRLARELRE